MGRAQPSNETVELSNELYVMQYLNTAILKGRVMS